MNLFFLITLKILLLSPGKTKDPWNVPLTLASSPQMRAQLKNKPGIWMGKKDQIHQKHIQTAKIKKISFNKGGSTISLRLVFADGSKAAFKPEQYHEQTVPRFEIAAYVINKLLGLDCVAPATWRTITKKELFSKLVVKNRYLRKRIVREIKYNKDGTIDGEVSTWIKVIIPVKLESLKWRKRWIGWVSPWGRLNRKNFAYAAQISNMIIFDYMINNPDRFSGNNTFTDKSRKKFYFMDNTYSFYPDYEDIGNARFYLNQVRRFSLEMIRKIQKFTTKSLKQELAKIKNPPWKILSDKEIKAVMTRRNILLDHINKKIAQFGWSRTVVFP
ncbi:MAG: hypothetical protein PF689_01605 [Deltaproteobacteria bacterium]|nr:hypothetical protein [Deltaproteobacteria bacterium]